MELPHVQAAQEEAARSLADMVRDKFSSEEFPRMAVRCEIVTGPLLKPSLYGSRALERIEAHSIAPGNGGYGLMFRFAQRVRVIFSLPRNEAGAAPFDNRLPSFETRFPQCIIM